MNERLGFVFPGQGPQYVKMGQEFYNTRVEFGQFFRRADEYLYRQRWSHHLIDVVFDGPHELLNDTRFTQPALYVLETATEAVLHNVGIYPTIVSGHSVGMFAAYYASGVLTFDDGLKLVSKRSEAMYEAGKDSPGKMAAVRGSVKEIEHQLEQANIDQVWIANHNSPEQVVISGEEEAVEKLSEFLKNEKVVHKILPVSIASHCPLMDSAKAPFALAVNDSGIRFSQPSRAIVLDTKANFETSTEAIKQEMVSQLVSRVLWVDSVRKMIEKGITTFIEVGPGKVLSELINKIDPSVLTFQVSDEKTLSLLLKHLGR